jgi:hypothetical protein
LHISPKLLRSDVGFASFFTAQQKDTSTFLFPRLIHHAPQSALRFGARFQAKLH